MREPQQTNAAAGRKKAEILSKIITAASLLLLSVFSSSQSARDRGSRVELGTIPPNRIVTFVASSPGKWGIEVAAEGRASALSQPEPIRLEIFHTEADIRPMRGSYTAVEREADGVLARAEMSDVDRTVSFRIEDHWSIQAGTLSVRRSVRVVGHAAGGFTSGLMLAAGKGSRFSDTQFFAPAALYGGPGQNNEGGPVGSNAFAAGSFAVREDALPAPLLGLRSADGSTVTILDPAPKGETTEEDTRGRTATVLIDHRFQFGAFGAHEGPEGGLEFGFWYPGGVLDPPAPVGSGAQAAGPGAQDAVASDPATQAMRSSTPGASRSAGEGLRRYHPMVDGLVQTYQLAFRFAEQESLADLYRNSWRWAWESLHPPMTKLDIELVRKTLFDHVADRVMTIDGRAAIPWIFQVTTGTVWHRPDDMRSAMGFVGKNLEIADEMLMESDRDATARGRRLRELALAMIQTYIRQLPMSPPAGEAFDLTTGEPTVSFPPSSWRGNLSAGSRLFLRAPSEDMRRLLEAYAREKKAGRDHPEWLAWCRQFADWLLPQQRPDGSFPRAWRRGTSTVVETSSTASYSPVPLLVLLSQQTGTEGSKYMDAALRAGQFVWRSQGEAGVFTGATLDHPNVIDKEAGMLSLEAFLSLYEATKKQEWLDHARVAADFTESWMYLWNVPMPADADDGALHWKKGVPTVGVGVIGIGGNGGCDEFLDWSAPSYARLFRYTEDNHYLDVARMLLRDTKPMLALPGRTYDMAGPGWQQENFNLSSRRGYGGHRGWLPWVSSNHLWSILGLEDFDPQLFQQLKSEQ